MTSACVCIGCCAVDNSLLLQDSLRNAFEEEGYVCKDLHVHERAIDNRKRGMRMARHWIQAAFSLPPGPPAHLCRPGSEATSAGCAVSAHRACASGDSVGGGPPYAACCQRHAQGAADGSNGSVDRASPSHGPMTPRGALKALLDWVAWPQHWQLQEAPQDSQCPVGSSVFRVASDAQPGPDEVALAQWLHRCEHLLNRCGWDTVHQPWQACACDCVACRARCSRLSAPLRHAST
jgi:hypothetical protein